jgi:hypothetical protein
MSNGIGSNLTCRRMYGASSGRTIAITGADRKLWVDFTPGSTNISYLRQALDAARQRSPIRFYGNVIGVIINYTADDAVRFDLNGDAVEVLSGAYRGGELTVSLRGKPVSMDALAAIFMGQ